MPEFRVNHIPRARALVFTLLAGWIGYVVWNSFDVGWHAHDNALAQHKKDREFIDKHCGDAVVALDVPRIVQLHEYIARECNYARENLTHSAVYTGVSKGVLALFQHQNPCHEVHFHACGPHSPPGRWKRVCDMDTYSFLGWLSVLGWIFSFGWLYYAQIAGVGIVFWRMMTERKKVE